MYKGIQLPQKVLNEKHNTESNPVFSLAKKYWDIGIPSQFKQTL